MNTLTLARTYPRYLGFGVLHMLSSNVGQTFMIALFIPHMREAFAQSAAAMGSWYGLLTTLSAVAIFFTGPLIDRVNLRHFSIGAGCVVSLGCLLLGVAPSLFVALLGLFLVRHGGQALMTHTAMTSMSRYFTMARGKALSIAGLGFSLGKATLPMLVALLLASYHWQSVYLGLAAAYVVLFMPSSLWLVNKHDDIQHPQSTQGETVHTDDGDELGWRRAQVLSHPHFWLLLPLNLMPPCLGTGFFFFQAELAGFKGWSMPVYASTFVAYGIAAAATSFVIGPLIDRFGGARMLPWSLLPMMLGIWLLLTIESLVGGYAWMAALGMCFGAVGSMRTAMWAEVYGRKHLGSIKSMASTIMICSTGIAPALGGWLIDSGVTVQSLLSGSLWLCAGATILALFARPPKATPA